MNTSRQLCVVLSLLAASFATGCVHRRMAINSNPPGALVLLEGEEVGYTPMSLDYTYYGTRELTLIKDGYKTLKVMQKIPAPWYQRGPLEFVSDNLALRRINDRRSFMFTMEPQEPTSSQDLLQRANELKAETQLAAPSPEKSRK